MENYPEITRPLDARFASWLAGNSPTTVAYHLSCGTSLPEREEMPPVLFGHKVHPYRH